MFVFETASTTYVLRPSWPMLLLLCGGALFCWIVYEEAIWQTYAYARWGRFEVQFDALKSVAMSVVAYLMGAGYFLIANRSASNKNRTRMRLLRLVLMMASLLFLMSAILAIAVVGGELISNNWESGLVGLLTGLFFWIVITLLVVRSMQVTRN
jgi:TRAP-type mannitol/chloroaromatic compound transport system permease small subunit